MPFSWECIRRWLPAVSAALAVMCGAVYGFRCETVASGQDENRYQYGLWYRKPSPYDYYINTSTSPDVVSVLDWSQHFNNGGSGPAVSTSTDCQAYEDGTSVDGLWKFLRALTLITLLLGGGWTVWMFLCNTILRYRDQDFSKANWNLQVVVVGTILAVLQGLGFLFTNTNACEFSNDACEWSTGLRANVASVTLWIVTAVLALWFGPPSSVKRNRGEATIQTVTYQRDTVTGQIVETANEDNHNNQNV